MTVGVLEGNAALRAADGQRQQHASVWRKLLAPRRRHVATSDGEHYPVVWRLSFEAQSAVGLLDLNSVVAGVAEMSPRGRDQVGVDVHGDDEAVRPDQMCQQRGVVASTRADLEHTLPGHWL